MQSFTMTEAAERLARAVEKASPEDLEVFHDEMFPYQPVPSPGPGGEALYGTSGMSSNRAAAVNLWRVFFPQDRNIWYDEEEHVINVNGEPLRYLE